MPQPVSVAPLVARVTPRAYCAAMRVTILVGECTSVLMRTEHEHPFIE